MRRSLISPKDPNFEDAAPAVHFAEGCFRRCCDYLQEIAVCERVPGNHLFGMQPTVPAMACRIDADPGKAAPWPAVMTVLNAS